MRIHFVLILMAATLGGCAGMPPQSSRCTQVVSDKGRLLKFCQAADKIEIFEAKPIGRVDHEDLTIVNDPATLAALARQVGIEPGAGRSKNPIVRACVVAGENYATIRVADLSRIAHRRRRVQHSDDM